MSLNLVWFRNDLRVADNPALWNATRAGPAVAIFLITTEQWRSHRMAACRVDFILRSLRALRSDLDDLGIPLVVESLDRFAEAPAYLDDFCRRHGIGAVYWNNEYPLDEWRRDNEVAARLAAAGLDLCRFHDRVICPPGTVVKGDGDPYQVFTPFKKRWRACLEAGVPDLLPAPEVQDRPAIKIGRIPGALDDYDSHIDASLWPAGEGAALERLESFVNEGLDSYGSRRDLPGEPGTSALSPYLAVGAVSPQRCLVEALARGDGAGPAAWIDELIWRDFYQHIAFFFPDICRYKAFKPEAEPRRWRNSDRDFEAWCEGKTGIPLVDAGMRQLQQCGWMHNRVRMVTAMFLSKNLLIDWRRGEEWFMAHLIDGDFPANNGGWQWSASTGTDAVPYFRIFNPFSQAARFDPEAAYIKRYVPELDALPASSINHPERLARERPQDYPPPVVDLASSRERALAAYGAGR